MTFLRTELPLKSTPEYIPFYYGRWTVNRTDLEAKLGQSSNCGIIKIILKRETNWKAVIPYIIHFMKARENKMGN